MRYAISCLAFFAACPSIAAAQNLQIVTDIAPTQGIVTAILGDKGEAKLLLEPGASAHHFSLKPSAARAVQDADLVIHVSDTLTPWIGATLQNRKGPVLELLHSTNTQLQAYAEPDQDAKDDHDHHHEHDDHHHDHSHGGEDPHAWLTPKNGEAWAETIARELGQLQPENSKYFQENARNLITAINSADQQAKTLLEPVKDRAFLTAHDAFGYFTSHYGLNAKGAISLGDGAAPGAKHLRELQAKVSEGKIICVFPEAGHDPKLAQQLLTGTTAKLGAPLNPEGSDQASIGPDFYPNSLLETAKIFADCLQDN